MPAAGSREPAGSAAAASPAAPPNPSLPQLNVAFRRSGGLAGRDETFFLDWDGSVKSGGQVKWVDGRVDAAGRVEAAARLLNQIFVTGHFAVAPGKYMPLNPCSDRTQYDLTITPYDKAYSYTTMDGSEAAPAALLQTVSLIQQYIASAK